MSPKRLPLAGKLSGEIIVGRDHVLQDEQYMQGEGAVPDPQRSGNERPHATACSVWQHERTGLSNISRPMRLSPEKRLN